MSSQLKGHLHQLLTLTSPLRGQRAGREVEEATGVVKGSGALSGQCSGKQSLASARGSWRTEKSLKNKFNH